MTQWVSELVVGAQMRQWRRRLTRKECNTPNNTTLHRVISEHATLHYGNRTCVVRRCTNVIKYQTIQSIKNTIEKHTTHHLITSHHIALRHITQQHTTLHHITSLHTSSHTSHGITLFNITSYNNSPHHIPSHYIKSHHTILHHHTTLYHITSYYTIVHHITQHTTPYHLSPLTSSNANMTPHYDTPPQGSTATTLTCPDYFLGRSASSKDPISWPSKTTTQRSALFPKYEGRCIQNMTSSVHDITGASFAHHSIAASIVFLYSNRY